MGGLIELVVSFGLFAACLAGGVLAIYNNLSMTSRLYEIPVDSVYFAASVPNASGTLEEVVRRDSQAYSALIRSAQNYGSALCNTYSQSSAVAVDNSNSQFRLSALPLQYPSGYTITFRRFQSFSSVSAGFYDELVTTDQAPILAQLRRVRKDSSPGPVLSEVLVRCSLRGL